jgi:hypothetical protein
MAQLPVMHWSMNYNQKSAARRMSVENWRHISYTLDKNHVSVQFCSHV